MRRSRLALGLALAALAAAAVGAFGPADEVRTTYSWPPRTLPDAQPTTAWHAPLMLLRRQPESISASVPCRLPHYPPPLSDASSPPTVLATARFPRTAGALSITRDGDELVVAVGERTLDRAPLRPGSTGEQCVYRIRLADSAWAVEGGQRQDARRGSLEAMPVVTGLFSELDLAAAEPSPSIEVTTAVHDVRPTLLQKLAWIVAAVAIAAAFGVLAFQRAPRLDLRHAAARAHPADAVVVVFLVGWWILSPASVDDGWWVAKHASYADAGGFSNYYDTLGSNVPLGFWLDWIQRAFLEVSDSLVFLRVPALLSLAATWALCRYVLARTTKAELAVWVLASTFLLGAAAWGMSLRPEFALALVVTATLACTVRFLERETVAPLACAAALVPLAALAHPAGIVAVAPLLVASPRLLRWARPRRAVAATLVVVAAALTLLLGVVDADMGQRREDAQTYEAYSTTTTFTWRDESLRYARLSEYPDATPVRRGWVALTALTVLAFLLRRRQAANGFVDVPAAALGLGLLLLIATPSKWAVHLGALIGVAALATASESARLRSDRAARWELRPFVIVGAIMLAAAWSWSPRTSWGQLDLRVLEWTPAFESRLSLSKVAFALPLVLGVALAVLELARRGRGRLPEIPSRVASYGALLLAAPALAFTVGVLAADGAKADGWTLARQNLGALLGDDGCGVADDLGVASRLGADEVRTYVTPDLRAYFPCVRQPAIRGGLAEAPDYAVSPFANTGLEAWETSPFHPVVDLYPLERLSLEPADPPLPVSVFEVGRIRGAAIAPPTSTEVVSE